MYAENIGFVVVIFLLVVIGTLIGWSVGKVYRPDGVGNVLNALTGITGTFFGLTVGMLFFGLERPFTLPALSTFFFAIIGSFFAILLVNWLRHIQYTRH